MSIHNDPSQPSPTQGRMLPRWAVPIVWTAIVLAIQVLLPWLLSSIGPRFGWSAGAAGKWNGLGILSITIGLGLYAWCLVFHYATYPSRVRIGFSPPHLVTSGPYRYSRNPMYLSALLAWLGWSLFFGSPVVLATLVLLWSAFTFRVIPLEERQLQALFGEEYLEYQRRVSRWLGWRSPGAPG